MAKKFPYELENGFLAIPNEVRKVYVKHPKIKPIHVLLYGVLIDKYSETDGYAFPTQEALAEELCVSKPTIVAALKTLEEVRLIQTVENKRFGNNVYYFEKPARSVEELIEWFPEIKEHVDKTEEKYRRLREDNAMYKRKYDEKRRSENGK
jgi:DNA-binding MarR family transcriptional regulator